MKLPFAAPSYDLESRPSGVARTVNMFPVPIEPGNERTAWVLKDAPGLVEFAQLSVIADPVTWNPDDKWASVTLTNSDLTASNATSDRGAVRSTARNTTGKRYWEVRLDAEASPSDCYIGVAGLLTSPDVAPGLYAARAMYRSSGFFTSSGPGSYSDGGYAVGDVIGVAWNLDTDEIWFYKNGVSINGGDAAAGTSPVGAGFLAGSVTPQNMTAWFGPDNNAGTTTVTARFAQGDWQYTAPAGFVQLTNT